MKFLLIPLLSCTLVCKGQGTNDPVGIIENRNLKITSSLEQLKSHWNDLLKSNQISSPVATIELRSFPKSARSQKTYYLFGLTQDLTTKIAVKLHKKKNKLYLPKNSRKTAATHVICTGCITGCDPALVNGYWYCANGCNSTCTKIATISF